MHMKVMIYLSSRMHELKAWSRDAIMPDTSRSTLACGDHPKEPTRAVCEHASTCARLQCGLAASCCHTAQAAHVGMMKCWGNCATCADGRSEFWHRGWARPNSPRKGGRKLGFHLDLWVELGGTRALHRPRPMPSATKTWARMNFTLTATAGGLRSRSARKRARNRSLWRALRALVGYDLHSKPALPTFVVFGFSGTRQYGMNPL